MPTPLTLGPVSSVGRGGTTLSWTIPGTSGIASAAGFVAGSKVPYLRFQINPGGGGGLGSLPGEIDVYGNTWAIADPTNSIALVGDSVGIGDISGIINHATNEGAVCHSSSVPVFTLPTTGLSLSTLNGGGYYIYVGLSTPSGGTISVAASGNYQINGGALVPWSAPTGVVTLNIQQTPGDTTANVMGAWIIMLSGYPSSQPSASVSVTPDVRGQVQNTVHNAAFTVALSNSFGGSASGAGSPGITLLTPATTISIPLSGGSGIGSFNQLGAYSGGPPTNGQWVWSGNYAVSPVVVANSIIVNQISASTGSLQFRGKTGGPTFGGTIGVNGGSTMAAFSSGCDEMTTAYLSDVLDFYAQFTDPATGAPANPTGTPTFRIYNQLNGTVLATGTLTQLDSGSTVGFFGASVTLNGSYTVGHCYVVVVLATVATVSQEGIVERFIVRDTISNTVFGGADPGPIIGRPTTIGGLISTIYRYLVNFQSVDKLAQTQTLYSDDNSTVMLSGSITANSQNTTKGKMS